MTCGGPELHGSISRSPLLRLAIWAIGVLVITSFAAYGEGAERPDPLAQTKSTTRDPLTLNKPLISPSAIAPASEPTQVAFGAMIVGTATPPAILYLDEVTNSGKFISEKGALRDDGKGRDKQARDGFYSGTLLELGSKDETERYFRLRAEYFGKRWFPRLPSSRSLDSRLATDPLIRTPWSIAPMARTKCLLMRSS